MLQPKFGYRIGTADRVFDSLAFPFFFSLLTKSLECACSIYKNWSFIKFYGKSDLAKNEENCLLFSPIRSFKDP